jgi:hypothetical protein
MQALKIIESYRAQLTADNIVICTYLTEQYGECDCIDISYEAEYPQFEVVDVIPQPPDL